MSFLKTVIKSLENEYAGIVEDGTTSGDCEIFIDTGSFVLNALISGSVFGGLPANKITALAGESGTGKTFFALSIVKHFLDNNSDGQVIYFESESAISKKLLTERNIDIRRVGLVPVTTVQEFRTQALKVVDEYMKLKKEDRPPLLFVLDSLGMLSTTKELEDSMEGKETRDMTRAQIVKSIFRVLTLKLGQAQIPLLVTNHTYDVVGSYVPTKEMGGGTGLKYAASTIIFLSKSKEKDGKVQIGNIIKCRAHKSRFTKENSQVETRLYFDERGLDKYYGLLELAAEFDIIKYSSGRYEINGNKYYAKQILKEPEKFFTEELLEQIDKCAKLKFTYGSSDLYDGEIEE